MPHPGPSPALRPALLGAALAAAACASTSLPSSPAPSVSVAQPAPEPPSAQAPAASAQAPASAAASAQATGSAQASAGAAASALAASLAGARRWRYQGELKDAEGKGAGRLMVAMVELVRRKLDGVEVQELAPEIDGRLLDAKELADKGLNSAPFSSFPARLIVLRDDRKPGQVWVITGDQPPSAGPTDDAAVRKLLGDRPTFQMTSRPPLRAALGKIPADRSYTFRDKIGAWASHCAGYAHPSPDTGDFFASETCYAGEAGVTRMAFDSVWGSYRLDLVQAPP